MRHAAPAWRILAVVVAAGALVLVDPTPAAAASLASHGPRTDRVVALTIDDGWSPRTCRAIFDILERRHIPATFFPVGSALSADRALWREIAARGYPIGDHTATHTHLAGKSVAVQEAAIAAGAARIKAITGYAPIPVIRPPAALWDGSTLVAASLAGQRLVLLWDTTFGDTNSHPVEAHLIANATRGRKGSVILMHCNHAISARVLERVIDAYLARGFEFVTIPQLFGFSGPVPRYPAFPSAPTIGRPEDVAARLDRLMGQESGPLPAATVSATPSAVLPSATASLTAATTATEDSAGAIVKPDTDLPNPAAVLGVCVGLTSLGILALCLALIVRRRARQVVHVSG